ncbi:MAG: dockerin type I repeat-containing protein [Ruminococcus sp.]|uniref:dockerin type I repeat-containing protein n=1 Tax=Ruminococcus sp. TaxID=41978 RepID=UPI0025DD4A4C|nr:dockerin type I repeat-containing protein [Ruminococcus sp.]MCR5601158.1 dockerin type I repeat-containing protein [Ruminococcus sp.]
MKLYKQLFAFLASAAMVMSSVTSTFASADIYPDDEWEYVDGYYRERIPDWVPKTYLDALEFSNEHGSAYTQGKHMCIVQQRTDEVPEAGYYDISSEVEGSDDAESYRVYYADLRFSRNDIPDKSDTEAYEAFMERLDAVGCDIEHLGDDNYFRVEVYTSLYQTVDVTVKTGSESYVYTFKRSGLEGEQLDVFRFLPDCPAEYDEFIKEHGNLCAYEDYIVYCGDVPEAAGYRLEMRQSGSGRIAEMLGYNVEKSLPSMSYITDGGTNRVVRLYKVVSTGNIDVEFTVTSPDHKNDQTISKNFSIEAYESLYRNYKIVENHTELPEWIPTDFDSAREFECKHGATYIQDGYIVCVRRMQSNGEDYNTYISSFKDASVSDKSGTGASQKPSAGYMNVPVEYESRVSSKIYGLGIPKKPDKNDREEYNKYLSALEKYGLNEKNANDALTGLCYSVEVFKPEASSWLEVKWDCAPVNVEGEYQRFCRLKFETDEDGNIKETDLFGWLPDCVAEAEEFAKENGVVSVRDGYIIFCQASHGHYLETIQDGIPEVKEVFKYYFNNPHILPVEGDEYAQVFLYKGTRPGTTKMTFNYSGTVEGKETKFYRFDINCNVEEISARELDPLIKGDCNYDGAMGISDVVTLQSWLLNKGKLKKAENADINEDGVIDIFDLISMRKMLLNGSAAQFGLVSDPKPMLVCKYENHAWGIQQRITVYDENGDGYSMEYYPYEDNYAPANAYDKLIKMDSSADTSWYDTISGFIGNNRAVRSRMPDEVIGRTRKLSDEISDHVNDKSTEGVGLMNDAGQSTIYLIGADKSGKPMAKFLFTSGDCLSWVDCKELQDYIKYLSYSSFGPDIYYINILDNNVISPF